MTDEQKWKFQCYVRALRRDCRTPLPVRVRRRKIRPAEIEEIGYKVDGFTDLSKDGKFIWLILDQTCSYSTLIDCLIHEWAHAIVHPVYKHGKMWGLAFADAYMAFDREATRLRKEKGGC